LSVLVCGLRDLNTEGSWFYLSSYRLCFLLCLMAEQRLGIMVARFAFHAGKYHIGRILLGWTLNASTVTLFCHEHRVVVLLTHVELSKH